MIRLRGPARIEPGTNAAFASCPHVGRPSGGPAPVAAGPPVARTYKSAPISIRARLPPNEIESSMLRGVRPSAVLFLSAGGLFGPSLGAFASDGGKPYVQTMTYVNPSQGILSPALPCLVADTLGVELDVNYAGACFYVPVGARFVRLLAQDDLSPRVGMHWGFQWICSGDRLPLPPDLGDEPGDWFWVYAAGAVDPVYEAISQPYSIDPRCPEIGVAGTITAVFSGA